MQPLPLTDWRLRWLVTLEGERLHRVASIDLSALDADCVAVGVTVCGYRGNVHIPGFAARMAGPRCVRCCKLVGIPPGNGAPFNVLSGEDRER